MNTEKIKLRMQKEMTEAQQLAAHKLALIVCDAHGHAHLPFNSVCAPSLAAAEGFFRSMIRKKQI